MALLVPPPVQGEIDGLRRACGDGALGRMPAHCTLVPPVNVRDDRLADAVDVLRSAAAETRPFTVDLGPVATFLPDSPTLYLEVSGAGLDRVGALRDLVFREPLARPLTWPFVPHVTLADELPPERITAALDALADYRATVTFERVHLLEEGDGRVWTPIADVTFAAPAVVGRGGLELELSTTADPDPDARAFLEREWSAYDVAEFGRLLDAEPVTLTARRDGRVVGVARGRARDELGYLSELMVAADARGEGIGAHLLAAFGSWAAGRGCTRLAVRTAVGSGAEAFYRRHGWVEEARLPRWMAGRDFVQLTRDC